MQHSTKRRSRLSEPELAYLRHVARKILDNDMHVPRNLKREPVEGVPLWTPWGYPGDHGTKGQRGYVVNGIAYAKADHIVCHALLA